MEARTVSSIGSLTTSWMTVSGSVESSRWAARAPRRRRGMRTVVSGGTRCAARGRSTGRNFSTEHTLVEEVLTGRYATGFQLGLMAKDVGIAADLAAALDLPAPVCAAVLARLRDAADGIGPTSDHSAAIAYWDRRGPAA